MPSILQIAYHHGLLEARRIILENDGYEVTSVLGNDQGIALAGTRYFSVIVVGFSAPHAVRSLMIRWLKQHSPETPVVALLANDAESLPEADCETLSEDPRVWLAAVAECIKRL